jgi:lipoprotein signal peptidase
MINHATSSYRWLFWTLALFGLCLDQGSKYGVFAWLYQTPGHRFEVVANVFYFDAEFTEQRDTGDNWRSPLRTISSDRMPKVNHGALWGIGGGEANYNHLFAIVSIVAAVVIVGWSVVSQANDRWMCMALGLILAGTLGNLYDRIVFLGVRDFLHWVYLFDFPVFNIADSCLVCGASLLLIQAFFAVPQEERKPVATLPATAATVEHLPKPETAEAS